MGGRCRGASDNKVDLYAELKRLRSEVDVVIQDRDIQSAIGFKRKLGNVS